MTETNADEPRPTVINDTIARIRAMIADGQFPAGHRMPTERELSSQLGVSRSSLREAIRALTLVGVLDSRHGAGTYVTDLGPSLLLDAFSVLVQLSPDHAHQHLLEVRRALDGFAASQAASKITDAELADLCAHLDSMGSPPPDDDAGLQDFIAQDMEFHVMIARASGNPVLAALIESLGNRTIGPHARRAMVDRSIFKRAWTEHRGILNALIARDPAMASTMAAAHVAEVQRFVANLHSEDVEESIPPES